MRRHRKGRSRKPRRALGINFPRGARVGHGRRRRGRGPFGDLIGTFGSILPF